MENAILVGNSLLIWVNWVKARVRFLCVVLMLVKDEMTYSIEEAVLGVEGVDEDLVPVGLGQLHVDDELAVRIYLALHQHPLELVGERLLVDPFAELGQDG